MNVYGIIYKTTNLINDKIYIGQTTQFKDETYLGSGMILLKALKKYGKENFIRETLRECKNQVHLDIWEEIYIRGLKSFVSTIGYNIALGSVLGKRGNKNPSKLLSSRRKMSENHRSKQPNYDPGRLGFATVEKYGLEYMRDISKIGSEKAKKLLSKAVIGTNREDGEVREFSSTLEAEIVLRKLGYKVNDRNIASCCRGVRDVSGNWTWKYK